MHALLISNSTTHPSGYLDHCAEAMKAFLGSEVTKVLFVPFALQDQDDYAAKAIARFNEMGLECDSLHKAEDKVAAVNEAQAMFVGGGNTFRLCKKLHEFGLVEAIRDRVKCGELRYMGASAGSNVACPTIMTTNDMPIVQPPSFEALHLVPFQINAHYLEPDPSSTHKGETRAERLAQYHEEQSWPVVGLPEGCWIEVHGVRAVLGGMNRDTRLFRQHQDMVTLKVGDDLDMLYSS